MVNFTAKNALLLLSVLSLMTSAACTKKHDDSSSTPDVTVSKQAPTPTPAPGAQAPDVTGGKPAAPAAAQGASAANTANHAPSNQGHDLKLTSASGGGVQEGEILIDPQPLTEDAIESDPIQKRITGAAMDGSLFSTASDDSLMPILRARLDREQDADAAERNRQLAAQIKSIVPTIDMETRDVKVTLVTVDLESHETYTNNFSGFINENGVARLRNITDLHKRSPLYMNMVCVDADKEACETAVLKIGLRSEDAAQYQATAYAILRDSHTSLDFALPHEPVAASKYLNLESIVYNSVDLSGDNRIVGARVRSFEVAKGRSAFLLYMHTTAKQAISYSAPLMVDIGGGNISVPAKPILTDEMKEAGLSSSLMSTINEVKAINNDGKGSIKLQLVMREGRNRNSIILTAQRQFLALDFDEATLNAPFMPNIISGGERSNVAPDVIPPSEHNNGDGSVTNDDNSNVTSNGGTGNNGGGSGSTTSNGTSPNVGGGKNSGGTGANQSWDANRRVVGGDLSLTSKEATVQKPAAQQDKKDDKSSSDTDAEKAKRHALLQEHIGKRGGRD